METNPHLDAAIMEVVENQLRDLEPPETKQTYERLLADGVSKKEAKRLIGYVVAAEIYYILKREEPFNRARFVSALSELPDLPSDE